MHSCSSSASPWIWSERTMRDGGIWGLHGASSCRVRVLDAFIVFLHVRMLWLAWYLGAKLYAIIFTLETSQRISHRMNTRDWVRFRPLDLIRSRLRSRALTRCPDARQARTVNIRPINISLE